MEQCYINLAIVEHPGKKIDRTEKESKEDKAPQSSPFSLLTRLKIETPNEESQIKLSTIFDRRKGHKTPPRRVLIRGHAGVGKTTLCKKLVYDFTYCEIWKELFDRVIWVPLRNLKGTQYSKYNFGALFYNEYFIQKIDGTDLAKELWQMLEDTRGNKTLFILDGLDEIFQDLGDADSNMSRFLRELLNQPNAIITSRPSAAFPTGVRPIDLQLETIGFHPDQVESYLKMTFHCPETVNKVQSFLQNHGLVRSLVRIPIQLDALCYT